MDIYLKLAQEIMQRADILAQSSEDKDGLTRSFLSEPMHDVHRQLKGWMQEAGMATRVDAIGNLIGSKKSDLAKKAFLLGSHLDTVKNAGKYDGILGVLLAVAVAKILQDETLAFDLDIIAFSEEEGLRFSTPMFGSKTICGTFDKAFLDLVDENGISVREAIISFGLDPNEIENSAYDPDKVLGFLEVHIEQGPRLAAMNKPLAIVSAINGATWAEASFSGKAGHAGTSPMDKRQDALLGAAEFALSLEEIALKTKDMVATVGKMYVKPGSSNVIPSNVSFSIDLRHPEDEIRQNAVDKMLQKAERIAKKRNLNFEYHENTVHFSTKMQQRFIDIFKDISPDMPIMPSGAGHDAMIMADFTATAMLFVRSPNGISHSPEEIVLLEDVAAAIKLTVEFILKLSELEIFLNESYCDNVYS